jgi:hypothetical protein
MFQFYSVRAVIALNFSLKMNMEWSIALCLMGGEWMLRRKLSING